jgi:hypothetical protein
MGVMDDTFYYNADYKVLICKYHGGGVVVFESLWRDAHNLHKKKDRL